MLRKKLVILETSDVHGCLFPINYGNNASADVGMGKLATLIHNERAKYKDLLLIENGDLIQGTPLMYHHARFEENEPNPIIMLANELKYDAGVFGNHEFNYGLSFLKKAVKEAVYPMLTANLLNEETMEPFFGQPYMTKEFEDLKVGILGLTTPYIPNWEKEENIKGIHFEDALESAHKWVRHLKENEQVDVVIVAYHGGLERDPETGEQTEVLTGENQGYAIAANVPGIDVLLTGHQHRLIPSAEINGVHVVQPGNNGMSLGKVELDLVQSDGKWTIEKRSSDLIPAEGVKPDMRLLQKVEDYEKRTQTWLDQPIGRIEGDMAVADAMEVRMKDNALIEFFNDVQMKAAGVDISNTALFDNQSPGLPEHVTMRDVVANYIYPNTLKVIRITGKDMREALERSAAYFKTYEGGAVEVNPAFSTPKPQHYNYDMWEGIDYLLDIRKPYGERVVKLEYKGEPVGMDKTYDVVMNNYRSGGGGDYFMYKGKPVLKDIQIDVSELIANEILEKKVIKATVNHNWKVIY